MKFYISLNKFYSSSSFMHIEPAKIEILIESKQYFDYIL